MHKWIQGVYVHVRMFILHVHAFHIEKNQNHLNTENLHPASKWKACAIMMIAKLINQDI